ncbi:MAG: Hsp20/alpha crystallin family protein [Candidatus Nitrosopolaris sp.]
MLKVNRRISILLAVGIPITIDMRDKGDKYNLRLEIPGINKDKIRLNATDILSKFPVSSQKRPRIQHGITYIMNGLTNHSIIAFRYQKK